MKLFDLSNFEKVSEDKNMTTMRHKDGHEIHIAHSSLPKIKQEQLKRLSFAKGGNVTDALDSGKDGTSEQGRAVRKHLKTKDPKDMAYAKEEAKGRADYERVASHPKIKGFRTGGMATDDMQDDSSGSGDQSSGAAQTASPAPVVVNVQAPNPNSYMQGPGNSAPQGQNPQVPSAAPDLSSLQPNNNQGPIKSPTNGNGQINPNAQTELGMQAADEKAQADAQTAQGLEKIKESYRPALEAQAQSPQKRLDELAGHTNAIAEYDRVHPFNENQYYDKMGTSSKVASLFGMLAGGFKQGMVGGNNPALDMLNQQVDRNIAGQKQRYENQKNVYGFYKDLYGAGNTADALTKASTRDLMLNDVDTWANKMGTAQAYAARDALKANWGVQNQGLLKANALETSALPGSRSAVGGSAPSIQSAASPTPMKSTGSSDEKAQSEDGKLAPDEWADTPILKPNAADIVNKSQFGMYANQFNDNQGAYNRAKAADRLLDQTHGMMNDLYTNAKAGGKDEYDVRRKSLAHIIPSIELGGTHIGGTNLQALAERDNDSPTMRSYLGARTRLVSEIANATKGTNLGQEEIQKIVDANLPEYNDSPKAVAEKERRVRLAIKNAFIDSKGLGSSGIGALNEPKKRK